MPASPQRADAVLTQVYPAGEHDLNDRLEGIGDQYEDGGDRDDDDEDDGDQDDI